jgi:hypothetical protein
MEASAMSCCKEIQDATGNFMLTISLDSETPVEAYLEH